MSRVFAAYSAGGLIGPALGAFGGVHGPFLAYLVLLVAAMPLVLFVGAPATRRDLPPTGRALRTRGFWVASAAIMFAVLALACSRACCPLHFAERLSQAQIGALYVGASLVVAVSAGASGGHAAAAARVRGGRAGGGRDHARGNRGERPALGLRPARSPRSGSGSATPARSACSSRRCRSSGSSRRWSSGRRSGSSATCSARSPAASWPRARLRVRLARAGRRGAAGRDTSRRQVTPA